VVFPDAALKIFLEASVNERALRRYKQLLQKGNSANLADLLQELADRDFRDRNRAASPLKPALDAIVIDSTEMSIEAVFAQVMTLAQERGLVSTPETRTR
jgi:CMP/dCMP kinase